MMYNPPLVTMPLLVQRQHPHYNGNAYSVY